MDESFLKIVLTDAMRTGGSGALVTVTLRNSGVKISGKLKFDDPPVRWRNGQVRLYADSRSVTEVHTIDFAEIAAVSVREP